MFPYFLSGALALLAGSMALYLASPNQRWRSTPLSKVPACTAGAMLLGVGLACLRQVFQPAAAAFVWCHVLMWLFLLFPYCGAWLVLRRKAA